MAGPSQIVTMGCKTETVTFFSMERYRHRKSNLWERSPWSWQDTTALRLSNEILYVFAHQSLADSTDSLVPAISTLAQKMFDSTVNPELACHRFSALLCVPLSIALTKMASGTTAASGMIRISTQNRGPSNDPMFRYFGPLRHGLFFRPLGNSVSNCQTTSPQATSF